MILRGYKRPRVEEERVQGNMFSKYTSVLTVAQWVVRRAEEYSAIIKLENTKCGSLPIYTNGSKTDCVTKY